MPILSTATPTVILKSVAHGGLALVRSLGREGVAVYTVEGDPWVPAIHSRYSRGWVNLDVETASAEETLRRLEALATKIGTDRKSTRLNSSHVSISYAVFCLKK